MSNKRKQHVARIRELADELNRRKFTGAPPSYGYEDIEALRAVVFEVERLRERGMDFTQKVNHAVNKLYEEERNQEPVAVGKYLAEAVLEFRAALHSAESFYSCPTCGENVTRYGQRCPTCERALAEDRLEREGGR